MTNTQSLLRSPPTYSEVTAEAVTRKSTLFGYLLCKTFFRAENTLPLFQSYAYFRWLDDFVDQSNDSQESLVCFVLRQKNLIASWYNGESAQASNSRESFIHATINYDKTNEMQLHSMITNFIEAIEWDVSRRYSIVSKNDLGIYSLRLGRSYAEGLLFGLGMKANDPAYDIAMNKCGSAAHIAHILRDLSIDLNLGYVNISCEDMKLFDIDPLDPSLHGIGKWIAFSAEKAEALFSEGKIYQKTFPNIKSRLVFDIVCSRYLSVLRKVKTVWSNANSLIEAGQPIFNPYIYTLERT